MKTEQKIIIGVVLASVILVVGGSLLSGKKSEEKKVRLSLEPLGEKIPEMKSSHVNEGEVHEPYNSNPPTSGPHFVGVAGPGIKTEPVADELVLHSMEHGAVVLWYKDDLSFEDIEKLKKVFTESSGKKIMIPRSGLDVPVALTSWRYLLKLETIDETLIKEFIEINNDRAPEKAPI